jgi:hypothetical protein
MNRYGTRAQEYWQTHLPSRYAQIDNPIAYFTTLGEEMAAQINSLALSLAGDDPAGEAYLQKVGRLNMARLQAEEQVIREMLPPSEDDDPTG